MDSDWAGINDDCSELRRSTSGCAVFFGGVCVSFHSNTQKAVAMSSAEAEYVSMAEGTSEAIFLKNVLEFMLDRSVKVRVYTDNDAARRMALRPGVDRVRRIDLKYLFVQELAQKGSVEVRRVAGPDNPADIVTKAVDTQTLERRRPAFGLMALDFDRLQDEGAAARAVRSSPTRARVKAIGDVQLCP